MSTWSCPDITNKQIKKGQYAKQCWILRRAIRICKKIRKIGFFYENRLHWQFVVEKILQMASLGYIFIYVKKTLFG